MSNFFNKIYKNHIIFLDIIKLNYLNLIYIGEKLF